MGKTEAGSVLPYGSEHKSNVAGSSKRYVIQIKLFPDVVRGIFVCRKPHFRAFDRELHDAAIVVTFGGKFDVVGASLRNIENDGDRLSDSVSVKSCALTISKALPSKDTVGWTGAFAGVEYGSRFSFVHRCRNNYRERC